MPATWSGRGERYDVRQCMRLFASVTGETITRPVIRTAEAVFVLVAGVERPDAVVRARERAYTPNEVPIQVALDGTWLTDSAAARGLRGGPA
jgi:6-phosphogluconolactonase/glucosamine-6-phosphate isomerase/deaminase